MQTKLPELAGYKIFNTSTQGPLALAVEEQLHVAFSDQLISEMNKEKYEGEYISARFVYPSGLIVIARYYPE